MPIGLRVYKECLWNQNVLLLKKKYFVTDLLLAYLLLNKKCEHDLNELIPYS